MGGQEGVERGGVGEEAEVRGGMGEAWGKAWGGGHVSDGQGDNAVLVDLMCGSGTLLPKVRRG